MDYRKQFKEYYHIDFDSSWEIHHIDLNHDNNKLGNLMLLPKEVHRRYHSAIGEVQPLCNGNYIMLNVLAGNKMAYTIAESDLIANYYKAMKEVAVYTEFMEHLKTRKTKREYPDVYHVGKEKGLWLL